MKTRQLRRVWSSHGLYFGETKRAWYAAEAYHIKVRLGICRTQIRLKTRRYFFSYRDQSGVVQIFRSSRIYTFLVVNAPL